MAVGTSRSRGCRAGSNYLEVYTPGGVRVRGLVGREFGRGVGAEGGRGKTGKGGGGGGQL